jgi:phosphotransferase system enzyme I (PtsI)
VVANDLSPADTIQFKNLKIGGFVTDLGGSTSHTAIVARSLAIPAVVGMQHARPLIQDDDLLIVDGTRGVLIVDPDPGAGRIPAAQDRARARARQAQAPGHGRARARSTARMSSCTPTSSCRRTPSGAEVGADGVGLFRTEFLFMNRDELPGEDEQFEAYRSVVKALAASRSPSARWTSAPTRRRAPCAIAPATAPRRTRRWACARSASAWPSRSCSWCSCARSCAPRTTARCAC